MAEEKIVWDEQPKKKVPEDKIIWSDDEPADHGLSKRQKLSPVERALSPITSYPETYQRMNREARDLMSSGVEDVRRGFAAANPHSLAGLGDALKGAAKTTIGGAGFALSPLSALYRSVAGQPIEDVTGIPREYTEFGLQLATPGLGLARAPVRPGPPPTPPGFAPTRAAPGTRKDVIGAADRLSQSGGQVTLPVAAASDSMPVQQLGKVTSNIPYAGTPMVRAAERSIAQLGGKADEVAQATGSAAPAAESGEAAGRSITNWITGGSEARTNAAYDKVNRYVDRNLLTPLDETADVVSQIAAKRTAAAQGPGRAVDLVLPAVQRAEGLSYNGIKQLRTTIGEMLRGGILPEGVSGGELKQLYGALSNDLQASVAASGPRAQAAFNRANRHYDLVTQRREALAKIVGANGDAPAEKVFDRLVAMAGTGPRADARRLAQARKAMGREDWDEVASSVAARLGRDAEGRFSPERFITAYNKGLSDQGKNLLFPAQMRQHLDDINTVSSRFKNLQKFANPSGTAQTATGTIGLGGVFVDPVTTLTTLLGAHVTARALARPATAASVARWSRAKYAVAHSPSASTIAAYTLASRNLLSTVGDTDVTPEDFLHQLRE